MKKILSGALFSLIFSTSIHAQENSIKSFFKSDSLIIYGTKDKKTLKDESSFATKLKKSMNGFINIFSDSEVSESMLKNNNLIIISNSDSNEILNFTNLPYIKSNFPFNFKNDTFYFGGIYYGDKKDSIVFKYPSPYNSRNFVLVVYGNSLEGLQLSLKNFKNINNSDYYIFNEKGNLVREGNFKKTNFSWSYDKGFDRNYENTNVFSKEIKTLKSKNFVFKFYSDSTASKKSEAFSNEAEKFYINFKRVTGYEINEQINVYLYESNESRSSELQNRESGLIKEIHSVFNNRENTFPYDLAKSSINFSDDQLIEKSFCLFAADMASNNIDPKVNKLYKENKIPNILSILKRDIKDENSELIIASFTKHLIKKYGFESYKQIITKAKNIDTSDELANISENIYTSFSRLEREWKYTLN